jgi:hypothetical protein
MCFGCYQEPCDCEIFEPVADASDVPFEITAECSNCAAPSSNGVCDHCNAIVY